MTADWWDTAKQMNLCSSYRYSLMSFLAFKLVEVSSDPRIYPKDYIRFSKYSRIIQCREMNSY